MAKLLTVYCIKSSSAMAKVLNDMQGASQYVFTAVHDSVVIQRYTGPIVAKLHTIFQHYMTLCKIMDERIEASIRYSMPVFAKLNNACQKYTSTAMQHLYALIEKVKVNFKKKPKRRTKRVVHREVQCELIANSTSPDSILRQGLSALLVDDKMAFSDITLLIDGQAFPCHRVILAAYSNYFKALFAGNFVEQNKSVIEIASISAMAMKQIVAYMYAGKFQLTETNVEDVLFAADFLLLPDAVDQCETFLLALNKPETCVSLWTLAQRHTLTHLEKRARSMAIVIARDMHQASKLLEELTVDQLKYILNADMLLLHEEWESVQLVLAWCQVNTAQRSAHLYELLCKTYLLDLDTARLKSLANDYVIVKMDSKVNDLLHRVNRRLAEEEGVTVDDLPQICTYRSCFQRDIPHWIFN